MCAECVQCRLGIDMCKLGSGWKVLHIGPSISTGVHEHWCEYTERGGGGGGGQIEVEAEGVS